MGRPAAAVPGVGAAQQPRPATGAREVPHARAFEVKGTQGRGWRGRHDIIQGGAALARTNFEFQKRQKELEKKRKKEEKKQRKLERAAEAPAAATESADATVEPST